MKLVVNHAVRRLCYQPYPGHPKGCPNFGKKNRCPPRAPLVGEVFDLQGPIYFIWTTFNLALHVHHMKEKHPEWSNRQAACCLYWQGGARKQLREAVRIFRCKHHKMIVNFTPEALGVDVTKTMRRKGVRLEWPPKHQTYQIAIAGYPADAMKKDTNEKDKPTK